MPPEAYRDWGKISVKQGDIIAAKAQFQRYLEEKPNAWDAKFIQRELQRL